MSVAGLIQEEVHFTLFHLHPSVRTVYPVIYHIPLYCRDRVSSCNIYAVQQDTRSVQMSKCFI